MIRITTQPHGAVEHGSLATEIAQVVREQLQEQLTLIGVTIVESDVETLNLVLTQEKRHPLTGEIETTEAVIRKQFRGLLKFLDSFEGFEQTVIDAGTRLGELSRQVVDPNDRSRSRFIGRTRYLLGLLGEAPQLADVELTDSVGRIGHLAESLSTIENQLLAREQSLAADGTPTQLQARTVLTEDANALFGHLHLLSKGQPDAVPESLLDTLEGIVNRYTAIAHARATREQNAGEGPPGEPDAETGFEPDSTDAGSDESTDSSAE